MLTDHSSHEIHLFTIGNVKVRPWPIASFRCAAEFGRYRGIADIEQTTSIKLDL